MTPRSPLPRRLAAALKHGGGILPEFFIAGGRRPPKERRTFARSGLGRVEARGSKKLSRHKGTALTLALAVSVSVSGCGILPGAPASMTLTSQVHPEISVAGHFTTALYSYDNANTLTILLLQGPKDAPTRAVTVRMFWQPDAGRTPITPHATDATIQYVVFGPSADIDPKTTARDGGGVGVYDGAGYFYPDSTPGSASMTGAIWQGDLRLRDASEGFDDPLGQVTLTGDLTARRDDQGVLRLLRDLSARVTSRLGYPRLVRRE